MYTSPDRHGHKETTITSTYILATWEPCHGGIVRLSVLRIASATVLDRANIVEPFGMAAILPGADHVSNFDTIYPVVPLSGNHPLMRSFLTSLHRATAAPPAQGRNNVTTIVMAVLATTLVTVNL